MICTYFITDGAGRVKIGKAKNPRTRLRQLQIGNPYPLRVALSLPVGSEYLAKADPLSWTEERIHQRFAKYHIRGEWFILSGEIQQFILDMIAEGA